MQNVIDDLRGFTGSEQVFKHWLNKKLVYTDGIQYLAKKANCYWLIDEISLSILPVLLKKHPDSFYSIQFVVHADQTANIVVEDGNGNIYLEHMINWTDFPRTEKLLQFYLCDSGDYYCLMLPSEY